MPRQKSYGRFLTLPENRSALLAVEQVLISFQTVRESRPVNLLYLHGSSGVGKSHLMAYLVREACQRGSSTVTVLAAGDFQPIGNQEKEPDFLEQAQQADLWILEDVHHLPARSVEALAQLLDYREAHRLPTVVTGQVGPRYLKSREQAFSARLTSRLAAGLVVELEPWQAPSRLVFLEEQVQKRQFALSPDIVKWLAENLPGSGRVLEGAMNQLEILAEQRKTLDVALVAGHFQQQAEAHQPTVNRIVQQVCGYFRLEPGLLQSRSRFRNILVPRQVGMYLARQLTELSLEQIGAFFGGLDHSTVLHACRKVEQALTNDPELSGAVRQIHAQLA
jgi:chromosomal replication initiator protein